MKKAIDAVLAQPWAITTDGLETIEAIANREHQYAGNLEALEAKLGRPLGNTQASSIRDGIATIPVEGPLFAKANLMTAYSGATSYQQLALDFTAAIDDPAVKAIILNVDSPGGQVSGVSELQKLITSARGTKPIVAFVSHMAASGGYWIACSADKIVIADTGIAGSIGVQIGISVADPKPGEKQYRFVSSNAANKNADPGTDIGAAEMQALVDGLEKVFVNAIAANRNIKPEKVVELYGQGAVFVASEALKRGMVDEISTYENVFSNLSAEVNSMDYALITVAALTENRPEIVAAIRDQAIASVTVPDAAALRAEGAAAERSRLAGIEALSIPGTEEIIAAAKADPAATAENTAIKVLTAVRTQREGASAASFVDGGAAALAAIQQTEANLQKPATTAAKQDGKVDAVAFAIAAAESAGIAVTTK